MTDMNQKINCIKNRKITEKSLRHIRNIKNTPKDYNLKNSLTNVNNEGDVNNDNVDNINNIDDINNKPIEEYYNKNLLPVNNIKKYASFMRSLQGDKYKWKLLHKRLLLSSKINYEVDDKLHTQLKNEAIWLKENHNNVVILNKSDVHNKVAPSVKNFKENYNVFKLPSKDEAKDIAKITDNISNNLLLDNTKMQDLS